MNTHTRREPQSLTDDHSEIDRKPVASAPSFGRGGGRKRGVTLVEVMIVVVILGVISAGVAVAVLPRFRKAQIEATNAHLAELRRAALLWLTEHHEGCPTVQQLVADRVLDEAGHLSDPWEMPFKIACDADRVTVTSFGPDRREGTSDDLSVPDRARGQ